jgi:hypothetical protein
MSLTESTICIAEERAICDHCPGTEINLFYPAGEQEFATWLWRYPQVHLQADRLSDGAWWNVKPQGEVIWIDSDVIVTRNITSQIPVRPHRRGTFGGQDKEPAMGRSGDDPHHGSQTVVRKLAPGPSAAAEGVSGACGTLTFCRIPCRQRDSGTNWHTVSRILLA